MGFPLKPEDKLLVKLLGIGVHLTGVAGKNLRAVCISLLQNGIPVQTKTPISLKAATQEPVEMIVPQNEAAAAYGAAGSD